jgi:hypothetical protein
MINAAGQPVRTAHPRVAMRPRRWYTDEVAPSRRAVKLTSELWRYRSLVRRRKNDAAPTLGVASLRWLYRQPHPQPAK